MCGAAPLHLNRDTGMDLFTLIVLSLVQGITEFLPVSSSGHLILVSHVTGWEDQGLLIDIALHLGTLGAVMAYFRADCRSLIGAGRAMVTGSRSPDTRLLRLLTVATLPIVLAGFMAKGLLETSARQEHVVAVSTIVFALVLYAADRRHSCRGFDEIGYRDAMVIGAAQVLALIPGTSRSGVTMAAARFLGLSHEAAARFSMLLSIPTICAATVLALATLASAGSQITAPAFFTAALLAFAAGYISIGALMHWLRQADFTPFVIYRLILGGAILLLA